MRILKFLFFVSLLAGCGVDDEFHRTIIANDQWLIVQKVESSDLPTRGKYKYTVASFWISARGYNGDYGPFYVYSNSLYNVQDTLHITK